MDNSPWLLPLNRHQRKIVAPTAIAAMIHPTTAAAITPLFEAHEVIQGTENENQFWQEL